MATPAAPTSNNPYAAPSARVEEVFDNDAQQPAERVIRLGAYLLDAAVFAVPAILMAIVLPAFALTGGAGGGGTADTLVTVIVGVFGILTLGLLILNLIWLHRHGQTIGKRILKIRIVRTTGERASLLRIIFARMVPVGLLSAIPFVGWFVALGDPLLIFREDRRCLHDLIADTMVVKAA